MLIVESRGFPMRKLDYSDVDSHNAFHCTSVTVGKFGSLAGITLVSEGFPCFLNSVMVLDMVALDKPSSSAVLVTEAPPYELRQFALFKLRSRIST